MRFNEALKHTLQFEGGYANDSDDRGGETFRGISRKNWPGWPGWDYIDEAKANGHTLARDINVNFEDDDYMEQAVADFYFINFWQPFQSLDAGDRVISKLFDTGVNMGVVRVVKFLQTIVNVRADGVIGPITCQAFQARVATSLSDEKVFLGAFCDTQAEFYRGIVNCNPRQGKFLKGWLRRAEWLPS